MLSFAYILQETGRINIHIIELYTHVGIKLPWWYMAFCLFPIRSKCWKCITVLIN